MSLIRWSKNPELLERIVRLRAAGKQYQHISTMVGLTVANLHYVYHTKLAKRLCRKLGLPHYKRAVNPLKREPKFSQELIETFVRLRFQERRPWKEIATITGHGWAAIRMACYQKGKEIRERLGYYRTKNIRAELAGKRFGRLKVMRSAGHNKSNNVMWRCKCSCGAFTTTCSTSLVRGLTKTCGDKAHRPRGKNHPTFKHGGSTPRLKRTWNSYLAMLRRCFRVVDESYEFYGGRGITVCSHWREPNGFLNFLASVGRRPANTSLDRIDPNQHYSCGSCAECVVKGWAKNCRWASPKVQANNRQCHHPPLTPEQQEELLRSKDPFLNPFSDDPVF